MPDSNATQHNCRKCNELDDERMAMCDKCDQWFHYGCMGVESNVADYSWNCEFCDNRVSRTANPNQSKGFEAQPSSSSSPLMPLTTTALSTVNVTLPISSQLPTSIVNQVPVSTYPHFYTLSSHNYIVAASTGMPTYRPTVNTPHFATNLSYAPNSTNPITSYRLTSNQQNATGRVQNSFDSTQRQKMLQLERLEEEKNIQQELLEKKYRILSESNNPSSHYGKMPYKNASEKYLFKATVNPLQ